MQLERRNLSAGSISGLWCLILQHVFNTPEERERRRCYGSLWLRHRKISILTGQYSSVLPCAVVNDAANCWATGELTFSFPSEKEPSAFLLMHECLKHLLWQMEPLFFLLLLVIRNSLLQAVFTEANHSLGGKPLFVPTLVEWLLRPLLAQIHCANGSSGSLWHFTLHPNPLICLILK